MPWAGTICGEVGRVLVVTPPVFLPSTSACLIAATESLCVGRMRMVLCQVRRHIVPGIPTRSAEGASVVCGCGLLVRRGVLGGTDDQSVSCRARFHGGSCSNLRREPAAPNTYGFPARPWTVPAACWFSLVTLSPRSEHLGTPCAILGTLAVSCLGSVGALWTRSRRESHRDSRDTWLVGGSLV